MRPFWITFGCGQPNAGCYHIISATSKAEAEVEARRRFGNQWSMCYESAEAAGVEMWGLREIK